jgi:predicted dehydrogenase
MPYWFTSESAQAFQKPNERPVLGCIGTGSRWGAVGPNAMKLSDCVAVCDVDANHAGRGQERAKGIQSKKGKAGEVAVYEDYRKILDRKDIDIVTIVTPDHWHSKIAIEAMQAGKDVYCEKPLTLTIDEGKQIVKVLKETGRVFQVGTQQRSEMGSRFLNALAIVNEGRLGKLTSVQCAIGGSPTSGVIPKTPVPTGLNWDMWLGQTPVVDYRSKGRNSRCHYEFRWWYEYSGGKMTDWGAHHVDIAAWGLLLNGQGASPTSINPKKSVHPVPFKNGHPTDDSQYNAATGFLVECGFPKGAKLTIRHDTSNGILFEGTKGRIFVSRGKLAGRAVDELKTDPLPGDAVAKLYGGKGPARSNAHMTNFMESVVSRKQPVSDVYSHHKALSICHLANIAIRLDRKLKWDPKIEQIVGDKDANSWLGREQRKGYEIKV